MAREKDSAEEFRSFVRDLGIRAFDQLATRFANVAGAAAKQSERLSKRADSLARLANDWSEMKPSEKEQFFEQMISAAQNLTGSAAGKKPKSRKTKKK